MSVSSHSISPAAASAAPPFRWLHPLRPTKFRVIVALGIGAMVLLLINLFAGGLDATAYLAAAIFAAVSYVLAEVLLVTVVVVGPFAGFIYGVIAFFSR